MKRVFLPIVWGALAVVSGLSACGGEGAGNSIPARTSSAQKADVPFAPDVDSDSFYDPIPVDDSRPSGSIIESRPIQFTIGQLTVPNPAWQIKYMTTNSHGKPIVGVATVVKPTVAARGGAKLVSYQIAYNGLGSSCTPSRTLSGNSENGYAANNYLNFSTGLNLLGWTMVFPDFEGPYHAYGAGRLAGQVTLDAIKAALSFEPLALSSQTPVAMWGYSGGAIATSWASAIHPEYSPDLKLVGAVSGGTPADLFGVGRGAENQFFFGLVFSALIGINREFPELFQGKLNEEGIRVAEAIKNGCAGGTTDGSDGASGSIRDYTTVDEFYDQPAALDIEKKISLPGAAGNPRIPMFFFHEILDEVIPVEGADRLVDAWCKAGSEITYLRSLTGEHVTSGNRFVLESTNFIESVFGNAPFVAAPTASRCNQGSSN